MVVGDGEREGGGGRRWGLDKGRGKEEAYGRGQKRRGRGGARE